MESRNISNNTCGLDTFRRDVNLMLKLLKLWWGERQEMVNEYKLLNKIIEFDIWNECGKHVLSKLEKTKFVEYTDLM